ncbi:hypothetical protein KQX54_000764 [Cotesia glomerata]|uniref:ABC transporter domain-containing protein n=1 Tax=Cotesia glomerata TaxID=32391 RepID=A0AAV7I5S3_COTGL|nr:hypothetical protein KQX54_000764 [Cotesia glomerata]
MNDKIQPTAKTKFRLNHKRNRLKADEIDNLKIDTDLESIIFDNNYENWLDLDNEDTFKENNLDIKPGQFTAISYVYKSSDVGLAITQSIGLTGMFQWGMRQSAEVENQMTSVERVLEYTNIESESAIESLPKPPVLKNLNFTIEPREKIRTVGRTGVEKSSLISALFRLADIEGNIEIDGIDTGKIGLHDFRAKISIIPQEPFLFSGSLRRNFDPFEKYPDSILWSALEDVKLEEIGLETHFNKGGSNLSVEQQQLVYIARVIVRDNKILVLDEL